MGAESEKPLEKKAFFTLTDLMRANQVDHNKARQQVLRMVAEHRAAIVEKKSGGLTNYNHVYIIPMDKDKQTAPSEVQLDNAISLFKRQARKGQQ